MVEIKTYPFDPTGRAAGNLIVGEEQIITAANWRDFHFIVPKYAPFFEEGLKIIYKDTMGVQHILVESVDWYLSHQFIGASRGCAKPVYGSISFLNTKLAGVVTIQYQTIGGPWVCDPNTLSARLAEVLHNPRVTTWEEVADLPYAFPPIDHEWDLKDMVGMSDVVDALHGIETQLRTTSGTGIADHIADVNNPHKVTATQVGLGNVKNYDLSTVQEATDVTNNKAYLTPYSGAIMVQKQAVTPLFDHVTDNSNPHHVTADQVGAYDITAMNNLLASKLNVNGVAADSAKLNGMLPPEFAAYVLQGTAENSRKIAGRTYFQLLEDLQGGASANALQFNGMNQDEYKAFVQGSGTVYNSARFGGVDYATFMSNLANSTVFNSLHLAGMDVSQLATLILKGQAASAGMFGGYDANDYAIKVLEGTAANAGKVYGLFKSQLTAEILAGKAHDSDLLDGLSSEQLIQSAVDKVGRAFAQQMWLDGDEGQTPSSVHYTPIAYAYTLPAGSQRVSSYPDTHLLVSGCDAVGDTGSALYLVTIARRGPPANPSTVSVMQLFGKQQNVKFGYTNTVDASDVPMTMLWLMTAENRTTTTVTDLTGVYSEVNGDGTSQVLAPTGFTPINGPYPSFADAKTLAQLQQDVATSFDGLTKAFNDLTASLGT